MDNKVLCSFAKLASDKNQNSPLFATISKDQRIKIWDTETGAMYHHLTEPNHLGTIYTSLGLFSGQTTTVKTASTNSSGIGYSSGYVAAGSKKGVIVIWKIDTAEIFHKLGDAGSFGHSSAVTDVVFNKDGTKLFSSGADGKVIEWDVKSGKNVRSFVASKQSITKIALSDDDAHLLTSGSNIKLWALATTTMLGRYSSHISPVNCLTFIPNSKYFVSGAQEDRFISVWHMDLEGIQIQGKKNKKKIVETEATFNTIPAATLSLESYPIFTTSIEMHTKKFVSCASINGVNTVWDITDLLSKKNKTTVALTEPITRITIEDQDVAPEPVKAMSTFELDATKQNTGKRLNTQTTEVTSREGSIVSTKFTRDGQLLVARNSAVHPQFELITFIQTNEGESVYTPLIILKKFESQYLITKESKKRKAESTEVTHTPVVTKSKLGTSTGTSTVTSALDDDALIPLQNTNETMHNKRMKLLEASGELTKSLSKRIQEIENDADKLRSASLGSSLEVLLTQALQADDDDLLEQCLNSSSSKRLIHNTISRISSTLIVPFLTKIIQKFQNNHNRSAVLVPWIRESLRTHAAYLLTVPQLANHITSLYTILERRLVPFKKLVALQGRIDLVLSQASKSQLIDISNESTTIYNESQDVDYLNDASAEHLDYDMDEDDELESYDMIED